MLLHCSGNVLEKAAETIMAISGPYLIECHQTASAPVAKCLKIRRVEIATRTLWLMQQLKLRSGLFCNVPLPCTPDSNEIVCNQPGALYKHSKFVCLFVCLQSNVYRFVNGNEGHNQYHGKIFKTIT